MDWRLFAALGVALIVAGFLIDRLLLAAEERGWIYWRRRKPDSGSLSSAAFGPVFDVLQPSRVVLTEEREHQRLVRHETGHADDEDPDGAQPADGGPSDGERRGSSG